MSSEEGGFTLIEMLVVLVLISISVALVYPALFNTRDRYQEALNGAAAERDRKREVFNKFITDGLPMRRYSSYSSGRKS